jgi:glycosyltransferase involved in cell wall biosynthesis
MTTAMKPTRIVTFTTLYPSVVRPRHGVFVEQRLRQLIAAGGVAAKVVAPVAWYPRALRWPARHAQLAATPEREERHGIEVLHPRYATVPKLTNWLNPLAIAAAGRRGIRRLVDRGTSVELIDAHYFYPDGAAAVLIARSLGLPVVVTARGSDLNLHARKPVERTWVRWAMRHCDAVITVSQSLATLAVELGAELDRVHVLPNGVDLKGFAPLAGDGTRGALPSVNGDILWVGNLVPEKDPELALRVLSALPDRRLLMVGAGPLRPALERAVAALGLAARVRFAGEVPQEQLRELYARSRLLLLTSASEGMPNVVLESLACGTPVVATPVGGVGEVITRPEAGIVAANRGAKVLSEAVAAILARPPARSATREFAARFDWQRTVRLQEELYRVLASSPESALACGAGR